jgi:hypothetical protein
MIEFHTYLSIYPLPEVSLQIFNPIYRLSLQSIFWAFSLKKFFEFKITLFCFCYLCFWCHIKILLSCHACNPSYSGGRDQEDSGLKPAWANSSWDTTSRKKKQTQIRRKASRVAQGVGLEFKSQYHKKRRILLPGLMWRNFSSYFFFTVSVLHF